MTWTVPEIPRRRTEAERKAYVQGLVAGVQYALKMAEQGKSADEILLLADLLMKTSGEIEGAMTYQVDFLYAQMGSLPGITIEGVPIPAPIMGYFWTIMNPDTGFALVMASNGEKTKEEAEMAFRRVTAAMTESLANLEAAGGSDVES